ncbi:MULTISPECIES: CBS domain-containing protein [unclassified Streptomyces]|uniref:CBS domain-containing protein n=1 Tax=unclassified Streptomyces TaxID=2593676 RepID=UPI0006196EA2|nr:MULTISPECIES: CBS domain-containing protein [unclassified Streptomyces]KKD07616.1 hypothetical protein TN53_12895 [Streptomyces sp. WM6386]KKD15227.1 hypothetical protein TR66_11960 [Streptomyces sp. WM6391]
MTPVRTQRQHADLAPVAVVDAMDTSGPRVRDDMTVEVALSVMAGARVEYLLLCDGDDQCTGSVTRAELAVHRDSSTYTDRTRLRDILGGAFTLPVPRRSVVAEHGRAMARLG